LGRHLLEAGPWEGCLGNQASLGWEGCLGNQASLGWEGCPGNWALLGWEGRLGNRALLGWERCLGNQASLGWEGRPTSLSSSGEGTHLGHMGSGVRSNERVFASSQIWRLASGSAAWPSGFPQSCCSRPRAETLIQACYRRPASLTLLVRRIEDFSI
jgi:hypothetical protein